MKKDLAKTDAPFGERFTGMVEKEFGASVGTLAPFGQKQKRLAQHLALKIDASLEELEKKRLASGNARKKPMVWANINMAKLATDAVNRIDLGLDALIGNHLSIIPYFNTRLDKYTLELRIGYVGEDYYLRQASLYPIIDITYELVYETDTFRAIKKTAVKDEGYEFEITSPFQRGKLVGGFGFIEYEEKRRNRLILVTLADFEKSERAGNATFWKAHPDAMKWKTIVHRTTAKIILDPDKITKGHLKAGAEDRPEEIQREIALSANKDTIDLLPDPEKPETFVAPEPPQEDHLADIIIEEESLPEMTEEEKEAAIQQEVEEMEKQPAY